MGVGGYKWHQESNKVWVMGGREGCKWHQESSKVTLRCQSPQVGTQMSRTKLNKSLSRWCTPSQMTSLLVPWEMREGKITNGTSLKTTQERSLEYLSSTKSRCFILKATMSSFFPHPVQWYPGKIPLSYKRLLSYIRCVFIMFKVATQVLLQKNLAK